MSTQPPVLRILDSATPPTIAQVAQAKAAGYDGWAGYIATMSGVALARPWTDAEFRVVLDGGLRALAYCSGWDDPVACKERAAALGIPLCLDVEPSIRADGSWVPGWLAGAGCGLYANYGVVTKYAAPFHILTGGPYWDGGTAPEQDWDTSLCPRPAGLTGWQFQGTHALFGDGVDTSYFDAGIWPSAAGDDMTNDLARGLVRQYYVAVFHREVESEAVLELHAANILANGYEQWVTFCSDHTPEAQKDISDAAQLAGEVAAMEAKITALQGNVQTDESTLGTLKGEVDTLEPPDRQGIPR